MPTSGSPYTNALRPRVTIKTIDGSDTLYTFDAYNTSNPITLTDLSTEDAIGESGSFSMTINDHNNEIPKDNIHDVKVYIEFGKTSTSFKHFIIGYGHIFDIIRPNTAAQFYGLSGVGSAQWLSELCIHRHEIYDKGSGDAHIKNVLSNAFNKRLWRPLKTQDRSIADITGISSSGISTTINTPWKIVDETFTPFSDLASKLADVTGAVWYVDYSTGSEIFTFKNNAELNTKIIIKSGDLADKANDSGDRISYIDSAFSIQDAATVDVGFANRLFSVTIRDDEEMWPLDDVNYAVSSEPLTDQALGQQIVIDNDARRITSLDLHLRTTGPDITNDSRLTGGVFLDKSNKPNMTNTLDVFHVDLSSIEKTGTHVNVPVDVSPKKLDVGKSKIWVCLFQIDEPGTVVWGHNNVLNTVQVVNGETVFSGKATVGDFDSKSKLSWTTKNTGPTYHVRVFSDIRRLFARSNSRSIRNQRLREQFIPTDFLKDPGDVSRYLSLILSRSSKSRRAIADFRVTIPDNFIFRPYQNVSFHDGLSEVDDVFLVQRAGYACSGNSGDDVPLGTLFANITLSGSYNTLVGACSCL